MIVPITCNQLRELIHYDPETGIFTWLKGIRAGIEAGELDRYRRIGIGGQRYQASQLAWLYMTGEFPGCILDHKNGAGGDDSWSNLRKATHSQNQANKPAMVNNVLGIKGVRMMRNKFCATIRINGVRIYLGLFRTAEEASAAYQAAAIEHHGEFAKW